MPLALCATALVLLALLWDLLAPRVHAAVRGLRALAARAGAARSAQIGYDPGRELRAEQRARTLLRSCVNEEEWAMYRDLGYVPARNGMAPKDFPALQKLYLTNRPNYVQEFEQWAALVQQTIFKGGRRTFN